MQQNHPTASTPPGAPAADRTDAPRDAHRLTLPGRADLLLDRPMMMGILNVTPDSFSDGGLHDREEAAVAHGLSMAREGARIIDVGGESTRPGAQAVDVDEQIRRTANVIARLRERLDNQSMSQVAISIDTTSAAVAREALDRGASIINDVTAGQGDDAMFELAASRRVPIVLMHMQGRPRTMQESPRYDDVVNDVRGFLNDRAKAAQQAGIARSQIVIDPGIGFGKTIEHNLALLVGLDAFVRTGYPVLLGASRKSTLKRICEAGWQRACGNESADDEKAGEGSSFTIAADALVGATCATTALGVASGVRMFRVHDVRQNRQAADIAWEMSQTIGSLS